MQQHPGEKENAECATSSNSWLKASRSTASPPIPSSSNASSDIYRAEELVDDPNPSEGHHEDANVAPGAAPSPYNIAEPSPAIPAPFHPFSIHVLSLLMPSSVFGTLARLGIHALASYTGQSIFPLAWVQAAGCGIMGFALAMREPITLLYATLSDFVALLRLKVPMLLLSYGPFYTAITTGFCGSLTTFSGWQLDVFSAWADASGVRRLWIYDVMDGLTRSLFTLAAAFASFSLGKRLGIITASRIPVISPPGPAVRWCITTGSIALYVLTIPFFVRLNHSWRHLATAALVLSFPGTLMRYILSTQLNTRLQIFPLGTLISNEFATVILAACYIIQRTPSPPSPVACSILQGFIDGFCGCLSTVSTFVVELRTLRGKKPWIYFVVSFVLGQVILLIMLGPAWWTGRIKEDNVCTFA